MGVRSWLANIGKPGTAWDDGCLVDYVRLEAMLKSASHEYRSNEPFPHIVIDDFLDNKTLDIVLESFPSADKKVWIDRQAQSLSGKLAQRSKLDFCLGRKNIDYEMSLHPAIRYLMLELNSITFLRFLQGLTGIPTLISDPRMWGGGMHQTLPGGMLRIHADFLKHPDYNLDRRLNMLLFLNKDWQPEWKGHLELWSGDMAKCERRIEPIANRCVIFTTSEHSYHGYTEPIACPKGESRKSIAMYYYSIPDAMAGKPKPTTYWQDLPGES